MIRHVGTLQLRRCLAFTVQCALWCNLNSTLHSRRTRSAGPPPDDYLSHETRV